MSEQGTGGGDGVPDLVPSTSDAEFDLETQISDAAAVAAEQDLAARTVAAEAEIARIMREREESKKIRAAGTPPRGAPPAAPTPSSGPARSATPRPIPRAPSPGGSANPGAAPGQAERDPRHWWGRPPNPPTGFEDELFNTEINQLISVEDIGRQPVESNLSFTPVPRRTRRPTGMDGSALPAAPVAPRIAGATTTGRRSKAPFIALVVVILIGGGIAVAWQLGYVDALLGAVSR